MTHQRLRQYVQDRLNGMIIRPDGEVGRGTDREAVEEAGGVGAA